MVSVNDFGEESISVKIEINKRLAEKGCLISYILSATTYRWAAFSTRYCNCVIQNGVQDGRCSLAYTLQNKSQDLFLS